MCACLQRAFFVLSPNDRCFSDKTRLHISCENQSECRRLRNFTLNDSSIIFFYDVAQGKISQPSILSIDGTLLQNITSLLHGPRKAEQVPSNMRKLRRFRSSCACAKYQPGLCSPFIHSIVSNDSVSGQRRP